MTHLFKIAHLALIAYSTINLSYGTVINDVEHFLL